MITEKSVKIKIEKLLEEVIELYQTGKQVKKMGKRIFRGRAVPIANAFENKFAQLLDAILPERYSIFVDYPLSYKTTNKTRKKTSYPDLAIIENGYLLAGIIELKIDLGYLSEDWEKKTSKETKFLRKAKTVSYKKIHINKAGERESKVLKIKPNFPRAVVILTGQNDHGRLKEFLEKENRFVLSMHIHPNSDEINKANLKEIINNIFKDKVNKKEWKKLANFLKKYFH
jgi:hypothetical protein